MYEPYPFGKALSSCMTASGGVINTRKTTVPSCHFKSGRFPDYQLAEVYAYGWVLFKCPNFGMHCIFMRPSP